MSTGSWVLRQRNAELAVDGEHIGVEAVQPAHLVADHIVEDALLADELAEARAHRRPKDLERAAAVDGELHLVHVAHADARAVVLRGKAAQELREPADLHVLAVDDVVLAERDDLLADGEQVAVAPQRFDVALDERVVVLADLDEVRADGAAVVNAGARLNGNIFLLICGKVHRSHSSFVNLCVDRSRKLFENISCSACDPFCNNYFYNTTPNTHGDFIRHFGKN